MRALPSWKPASTSERLCGIVRVTVDGVWLEDRLYFGGSTETVRHRNLSANAAACIHLESASDVVILHGRVLEVRGMNHDLAVRLAKASNEKYGYGLKPEEYQKTPGIFEFRPRRALGWTQFPKDVTRWDLDPGPGDPK